MARGWESKDIESQLEQAEAERRSPKTPPLSAEQMELHRRRETLLADRARVAREMEATPHPRRAAQLKAALDHLDREIARLPPPA